MNLQADINWIHQEIDKIRDPQFLVRVKSLLKERPSAKVQKTDVDSISFEELEDRLQRSEEDIKAGRVHTTDSLKEYFKNRA
ncbi:MAG: hypothetical protein AB8B61_08330 [Cyclobacteriaceae bacterium]